VWSRPVRFAQPVSVDVTAPRLAFSGAGLGAIGFAVEDQDSPAGSTAFATTRSWWGKLSPPRQIPGSQQVLGLAWGGRTLELLTGDSPSGQSCCSAAGVVGMTTGGRFDRQHQLVSGLAGATVGQLVVLGRRMLAAVATERGVWVAQSSGSGRWRPARQLAGAGSPPESLAAIGLPKGRTAVAWVAGSSSLIGPRSVFIATGSASRPPRRGHAVITIARSHGIDEMAIAPGPGGATAAWIESWYDARGSYHSEVVEADLARPRRTSAFPVAGTIASGLAFAGDARGDQVLAWKACTWSANCSTQAAVRSGGKGFGGPARLGSIDASAAPALAVSAGGVALTGWIERGHVLARALKPHATRFSATVVVSATNYADNLALTFGPSNAALAAWSQGTFAPDVVGAVYRR
jgi:hypothetical protein